jgi:hypothetical protein
VEQGAKTDGALFAKDSREPFLRFAPTLASGMQPLDPGLRQLEFLAAAVSEPRHDAEETFAFERQDVPTKRRRSITSSSAKALIVIGPNTFSFARIAYWVVRKPTFARRNSRACD